MIHDPLVHTRLPGQITEGGLQDVHVPFVHTRLSGQSVPFAQAEEDETLLELDCCTQIPFVHTRFCGQITEGGLQDVHVPFVHTRLSGQSDPFVHADEEEEFCTQIPFVVQVLPAGHGCVVSHKTHTPLEQTSPLH